jgi:hypothetical protein
MKANSSQIKPVNRYQWRFRSESNPNIYHFTKLNPNHCSCRGFTRHGHCWHLRHLERLAFFAELSKLSFLEILINLAKAEERGMCAQVDCSFCVTNHKNGCPRTADIYQQQAVMHIHGYEISTESNLSNRISRDDCQQARLAP